MRLSEIKALIPGQHYRVQIRDEIARGAWTPGKPLADRLGSRQRRVFVGRERRKLGGMIFHCALFTAPVRKGRAPRTLVSVPHYDLLEATAL